MLVVVVMEVKEVVEVMEVVIVVRCSRRVMESAGEAAWAVGADYAALQVLVMVVALVVTVVVVVDLVVVITANMVVVVEALPCRQGHAWRPRRRRWVGRWRSAGWRSSISTQQRGAT